MRFIDLEDYSPNAAWIEKAADLTSQLTEKHQQNKTQERNELIDANAKHWGKIKDELLTLSDGKCWFSESRENFSYVDVEHFRPKKLAKELDGTIRDGYWWLAFDYSNYRVCGTVGNRKKNTWFPLKKGSIISTFDDPCEESETPYLLDPTDPGDVLLIAFDMEGKAIPKPGVSDWESERVHETIKHLKLNDEERILYDTYQTQEKRRPLSEARRKIWQEMRRTINKYHKAMARSNKGGNPAAKQQVRDCLRKIRKMTAKSAEFSAVARCCVLFRPEDHQLAQMMG